MSQVWKYKPNPEGDKLGEKVKKDESIVMTSPAMATHLVETASFPPEWTVMEPCRGNGAFTSALEGRVAKVEWCEINEGRDYLEFSGKVDAVISNPPFVPRKLFWDFHVKAMETTRRMICWLINLYSLNVFTPKRLKQIEEAGWYFKRLHIVTDKRWFGRYVMIVFTRESPSIITFRDGTF